MRCKWVVWTWVLPALIGLPGCGSRSAGDLNPTEAKLKKIGQAYVRATPRLGHPPDNFEEMKQELGPEAAGDALVSPRDGQPFVVLWGIDYNRMRPPSRENPYIVGGYERNGVDGTRYVLCFPLRVMPMTDEELQKANFPPGYKAP